MRRRGRGRGALLLVPAVIAAALALAACGGDGDGDAQAIGEAIERVATTADPAVCTEVQTQRFTEQVVGEGRTGSAAIAQCRSNAGMGVAEAVEVSGIQVDGTAATAKAAVRGSTFDGQTLVIALVEEDGAWKLDELVGFDDFDRSRMIASFTDELRSTGGLPPKVVGCVGEQLERLSGDQLEGYFVNSDQEAIARVFGPCERLLSSQ